ncbi:hypothetical protein D3C77_581390 [compost metagenome]
MLLRLGAEINVFTHRHILYKRQFLVDDRNSRFLRIRNAMKLLLLTADDKFPAIGSRRI